MTRSPGFRGILSVGSGLWLMLPGLAAATQAHGEPEGVISNQLAHGFFILSMGVLIYWLRERGLVSDKGWRCIQYAALFFILWSLDAFLAHLFDEQLYLVQVTRVGLWDIHIAAADGSRTLAWIYYFLKLDHLLCVPALAFLLTGLRRLLKSDGIGVGPGEGG